MPSGDQEISIANLQCWHTQLLLLCFLNDTPDTFTQAKSHKCFSTRAGIVMARHSGVNTTWSIFVRFKGYIFLTMHALMHISNGKGTESMYLSAFCNLVEQILLSLNPLTALSLSPTSCEVIQELAEMFVHRQKTSLELQNAPVCPQHHQTALHLLSLRITPVFWHNYVQQPWWKNRSGTTKSIKLRKVLRVVITDTTVFRMVVMWLPLLSVHLTMPKVR